jgi:DNA-binding SARP family transcriptional activator
MRKLPLEKFSEPFRACFEHGRWDLYAKSLAEQGPVWLLEMDMPRLGMHLQPLLEVPELVEWTPQLCFLANCMKPETDADNLQRYYAMFSEAGDQAAAAATVTAAVLDIWNSGRDVGRLNRWDENIETLLVSVGDDPLLLAGLYAGKSFIAMEGRDDFDVALECARLSREHSSRAKSPSLMVHSAWLTGMALSIRGDFPAIAILIQDTLHLLDQEGVSYTAVSQMKMLAGLLEYFEGRFAEAEAIFHEVFDHPLTAQLPATAWLLVSGPLLIASSEIGKKGEVDALADLIRLRIQEQPDNHFLFTCIHYSLGISALILERPYDALLHGQEGIKHSTLMGGGTIHEQQSALIIAQALVDLGRIDEGADFLAEWLERWRGSGFLFFAACGAMEMARLKLRTGNPDLARMYFDMAVGFTSKGAELRVLNRPADFVESLRRELRPTASEMESWKDPGNSVVNIQTFGRFKVTVHELPLDDRAWRGAKSKALLKALIVHGGTRVPRDAVLDMLWPDTDGDMASNNLKVMLSRVRKIGAVNQDQIPWIVVRHGEISLSRKYCSVDCLRFRDALAKALARDEEIEGLKEALGLYTDDFLPNDVSESWIDRFRLELRELFLRGVLRLAEHCASNRRNEEALPYLQRAVQMGFVNEQLYGRLMRAYIDLGYPSMALQVFKQAKEALKSELDILPGPALLAIARHAREAQQATRGQAP